MIQLGGKQVIIIEDNIDDSELMMIALNETVDPDKVQIFHDGEKAIEYLNKVQIENSTNSFLNIGLIILDLQLPKVNGLEVLKYLRQNSQTKTCPVVIFTSSIEDTDMYFSYKFGANSYIRKPVEAEKFEYIVRIVAEYWLYYNRINAFEHH